MAKSISKYSPYESFYNGTSSHQEGDFFNLNGLSLDLRTSQNVMSGDATL